MIATILPGSSNFHAVGYNERKVAKGVARMLEMQNFGALGTFGKPTPEELVTYLQEYTSRNTRIQKAQFHVAFSCKGHEITEVEDTIPSIVMNEQLWKQDGSNRPELKIAYDQIGIAESSKKLTDSKYKPQLYVGIEGSYSSPGYNFKSDLDPNYAVYAKLSVPIFEWGKRRNEKRAASFQIGAATDNLHQVSDHVNLEVQTARVSLSQAMEQVQLTRNSLEKARKNEQMALERYTEGKVSIVEMIEAQNYRQISQTNYVQAKVSAQGHYSALLKALNKY